MKFIRIRFCLADDSLNGFQDFIFKILFRNAVKVTPFAFSVSWKAKLKYTIDQVVKASEDFDDFLRKCAEYGVLVEYDPDHKIDLKFMLAEQKERNPRAKMTRAKTLGWFYETETIKNRIAQYQGGWIYVPRTKIKERTVKAPNRFV